MPIINLIGSALTDYLLFSGQITSGRPFWPDVPVVPVQPRRRNLTTDHKK